MNPYLEQVVNIFDVERQNEIKQAIGRYECGYFSFYELEKFIRSKAEEFLEYKMRCIVADLMVDAAEWEWETPTDRIRQREIMGP